MIKLFCENGCDGESTSNDLHKESCCGWKCGGKLREKNTPEPAEESLGK